MDATEARTTGVKGMRVCVAHEWVEETGGAEKVLDELMAVVEPDALYCLWNDHENRYGDLPVFESPLARTFLRKRKSLALPVMSSQWRKMIPPGYDKVIVSSYVFAHHVSAPGAEVYAYVHSPARFLWATEFDPRGSGLGVRLAAPWFRRLDKERSSSANHLAANSRFVRDRIRRAWDRDAKVIYPPVDVAGMGGIDWSSRVNEHGEQRLVDWARTQSFVLGASRLVPYKRLDRVIRAGELSGLPVVIAGDGPARSTLESHAASARVPVRFVGRVSDECLRALFQLAHAYVFPPVEDFGIMPVEAMAVGSRVIVNEVGGTAESVAGVGGVRCEMGSDSGLKGALDRVESVDPNAAIAEANRFDRATFVSAAQRWIFGGDCAV